jgi:predicted extracellular nuclease
MLTVAGLLIVGLLPLQAAVAAQDQTTPICVIQGDSDVSPLEGETVTTSGVVYATQTNGFYLQDVGCDDEATTSDGIFVFMNSGASVGDEVTVTGTVDEFFGATEIVGQSSRLVSRGNPIPDPIDLDPEIAKEAGYYETLEHMRVRLVYGQTYVGTNRFGESFLVPLAPEEILDGRIRRTDDAPEIFALDDGLVDGGIVPTYAFAVVEEAVGPLAYTFGNYKLKVENPAAVKVANPTDRPASILPGPSGTLAVATWNLWNVFDERQPDDSVGVPSISPAEQATKRAKLARAVVGDLGIPAVIAVQEVETLELLEAIADEIDDYLASRALPGNYEAFLLEGNDPRGIDVGFLVDVTQVGVVEVTQLGKDVLSPLDENDDPICTGGADDDLLYDRVPLLLKLNWGGEIIYVVSNHFKSKFGGTPENDFFEDCRVEQARWLVGELEARGIDRDTIVTGDLNAFRDSPTLKVFEDAGYINQVNEIPEDRAYTFVFSGRVQFLDHVLAQSDLADRIGQVDSAKISSDLPFPLFQDDPESGWAASDHDPIVAWLGADG